MYAPHRIRRLVDSLYVKPARRLPMDTLPDEEDLPSAPVENHDARLDLTSLVATIRRRERVCLRLWSRGYTLQSIGDRFGLTRERVRQLNEKSVEYLRSRFDRGRAPHANAVWTPKRRKKQEGLMRRLILLQQQEHELSAQLQRVRWKLGLVRSGLGHLGGSRALGSTALSHTNEREVLRRTRPTSTAGSHGGSNG
jgi:hypothetical protein